VQALGWSRHLCGMPTRRPPGAAADRVGEMLGPEHRRLNGSGCRELTQTCLGRYPARSFPAAQCTRVEPVVVATASAIRTRVSPSLVSISS
jgi:hypothetical protein